MSRECAAMLKENHKIMKLIDDRVKIITKVSDVTTWSFTTITATNNIISLLKTSIKYDDHDVTDAELLMMMHTLSNSDRKLIASTIQTFEYISVIKEKIWKTIREEMIIDVSLMILSNSQTSRNQRTMMRFTYSTSWCCYWCFLAVNCENK